MRLMLGDARGRRIIAVHGLRNKGQAIPARELKTARDRNAQLVGPFRKMKTNFDKYLETQLEDPEFADRFEKAGDAWDVALQIAALRESAGLSQKELARRLQTSQQQVSRLESPAYEGHSLSMLRRVAAALGAKLRVVFEPEGAPPASHLAEAPTLYRLKRRRTKSC